MSLSTFLSTTSPETSQLSPSHLSPISVGASCRSPPGSLSTNTLQDITTGQFNIKNQRPLSVSLNDAVQSVKLLFTTIEGIWKKAVMLVGEEECSIISFRVQQAEKMVKAKSGLFHTWCGLIMEVCSINATPNACNASRLIFVPTQ